MLGLGVPELLILVAVVVVLLLAVRLLGRAGRAARDRTGGTPRAGRAAPRPLTVAIPAELQSRLRALAAADQRIQAIKLLREETGLGLLEAKHAVDAIAAGTVLPTPGPAPRADLAYRARSLVSEGREADAVRLVATETGMSAPEATTFVRALTP